MSRGRHGRLVATVTVGICLLAALVGAATVGSASGVREGGIFRITFHQPSGLDYVDPALASTLPGWAVLDPTCARLLTYPDKPPPAAFQLVPEVATGLPKISADRRTYTFTLRNGFRFNDGTPVRASAFARAIHRTLAPGVNSPGAQHTRDIVGAEDVLAGRKTTASGVEARGNTLIVRFKRPAPDFLHRTATTFLCAVQAEPPRQSGGGPRAPRGRPVLRRGVPPRRTRGAQAEPVLPRHAAAPRRRLRGGLPPTLPL